MSKWVCMECYEIYDEEFKPKKYDIGEKLPFSFCPKVNCNGEIVKIDDNMVSVIVELNKIGLETKFCCGAHVGSDNTNIYIAFHPDIESGMLGDLPVGFELEEKDMVFDKVCIRATIKDYGKEKDLILQQKKINKYIDNLLKWVEKKKLEYDIVD